MTKLPTKASSLSASSPLLIHTIYILLKLDDVLSGEEGGSEAVVAGDSQLESQQGPELQYQTY